MEDIREQIRRSYRKPFESYRRTIHFKDYDPLYSFAILPAGLPKSEVKRILSSLNSHMHPTGYDEKIYAKKLKDYFKSSALQQFYLVDIPIIDKGFLSSKGFWYTTENNSNGNCFRMFTYNFITREDDEFLIPI
jgi:hypothetical protein